MGIAQTLEDICAREAICVAEAERDDGVLWLDGVKELLRGTGRAAVVADFEQVGAGMELRGDGALDGFFGIAFEEHRGLLIAHEEDEGVVVARLRQRGLIGRRGEDIDLRTGPREGVARGFAEHGDVQRRGVSEERIRGRGMGKHTDPDFFGEKVLEDRVHASHVVGMAVGEGDGVEALDATLPEIRGDDVFAVVEVGGLAADWTSGIDEKSFALWGDDEERIAFAYVDGSEFHRVGMDCGVGGTRPIQSAEKTGRRARRPRAEAGGAPTAWRS